MVVIIAVGVGVVAAGAADPHSISWRSSDPCRYARWRGWMRCGICDQMIEVILNGGAAGDSCT